MSRPIPLSVPPLAERRPTISVHHGVARADDYAWLRDPDWQAVIRDPLRLSADIRAYLEAENAYGDAALADTAALQAALFADLRGRIKEDDSSVPAPDGPFAYATRFREGEQHPLIVRTPRAGGPEAVLLDANLLADGKAYFQLASAAHSPDHALLAWAADDAGSEFHTIHVRDLATGIDLAEVVPHTTGGVVWTADSRAFFYTWLDDHHRPSKVLLHRIGTEVVEDVLVYEEPDPGFFLGVAETQSKRFAVIHAHDHETSELRLVETADPLAPPRLVAPRFTGHQYDVEDNGERLFILTNADGADDFKIVTAPLGEPGRERWTALVRHMPGRLILSMTLYARHMVRLERENGLPRIVIRRLADGAEHEIAFAEEAYSLGVVDGYEFDTATLRFTYSSMTTPTRVYDYDLETRERVLRKEQEVPSGHDPSAYVTRRIMAPASDGELVPVSLLHRADLVPDGSAPVLLYGYGAYGIAQPAAFSTNVLPLVDRGFVYAIAHVRGGKDKGFRWYAEGRREKKRNSFTDFVAAARHLVATGYTREGRIVALGGSAGGLLVGAVLNLAPQLFGGAVAVVPFVDILGTMLDDTLPLTPPEWPEWGNPITDPAAFEAILSYAPYDNVTARSYPPILVIAGLTDPRVTYWEPAKWVAKLRTTKTDGNLLVLKTHMEAGHGGASGRFEALREVALRWAFALRIMGLA